MKQTCWCRKYQAPDAHVTGTEFTNLSVLRIDPCQWHCLFNILRLLGFCGNVMLKVDISVTVLNFEVSGKPISPINIEASNVDRSKHQGGLTGS